MIKPTVGRIVWFFQQDRKMGNRPLAAIIAHVWTDTCVNLAIFDQNGVPYGSPPTSVRLVQEGDAAPRGCYCTWMPYQIGQAQKYEEAIAPKKQ